MFATDVREFSGRHYESGTISNWLAACGQPVSEAMALGASGGIAFGYFMFEYTGHVPHVALLPRNTFAPFERTLDNLGVRRTSMETVKPEKGEENLRRELDLGNPVIIWADIFSASWVGFSKTEMWAMNPMLVVGYEADGFWVVDGSRSAFLVSAEEMLSIRGRVKKDRNRILVLDGVDEDRRAEGLRAGIKTCTALFLDKPPAGSVKNFGLSGMENFIKLLRDEKTALGWGKKFGSGDNFKQAVAGTIGQPGVWDWIEGWGTGVGADRGIYAAFLREAGSVIGVDLSSVADQIDESMTLWQDVAEAAMPDSVAAFKRLKEIKWERASLRFDDPVGSMVRRAELACEYRELWEDCGDLAEISGGVREGIAAGMEAVLEVEREAVSELRNLVG